MIATEIIIARGAIFQKMIKLQGKTKARKGVEEKVEVETEATIVETGDKWQRRHLVSHHPVSLIDTES